MQEIPTLPDPASTYSALVAVILSLASVVHSYLKNRTAKEQTIDASQTEKIKALESSSKSDRKALEELQRQVTSDNLETARQLGELTGLAKGIRDRLNQKSR